MPKKKLHEKDQGRKREYRSSLDEVAKNKLHENEKGRLKQYR